MAAERIDVLAVMDSVASGIHYPEEGLISITHHELWSFLEARTAVAELIEKSAALATAVAEETEYFATHKHLDEASFFENRVVQCTDELRAALGRMGEGA